MLPAWDFFWTNFDDSSGAVSRSVAFDRAWHCVQSRRVMIFGGFAQFFVTWLIEATSSPIAPSFYVMFGAAIGLVAAFFLVDPSRSVRLPTHRYAAAHTGTA